MKRFFVGVMTLILLSTDVSATNHYYKIMRTSIIGLGQAIERVDNIPVIGKLTALLPFAALATSLKECPIQTMLVVTAVSCYLLSRNAEFCAMLNKYGILNYCPWLQKRKIKSSHYDDALFVFDSDEEEYDEEDEDDLLGNDLLADEDEDDDTKVKERLRETAVSSL